MRWQESPPLILYQGTKLKQILVYMLFVGGFKALLRVCHVETGVVLEVVTLVTMIVIK